MTRNTVLTSDQIREYIAFACEKNGVPELAAKISWSWNGRFTSRMGDASYIKSRIRLSSVLFPRAAQKKQRNTVIHEAAHIIASYKANGARCGHDYRWKRAMIAAGERPTRCYSSADVDRTGLSRRGKGRQKAFCGCIRGVTVGPQQASKIRSGRARYSCRKCRQRISMSPPGLRTAAYSPAVAAKAVATIRARTNAAQPPVGPAGTRPLKVRCTILGPACRISPAMPIHGRHGEATCGPCNQPGA